MVYFMQIVCPFHSNMEIMTKYGDKPRSGDFQPLHLNNLRSIRSVFYALDSIYIFEK